MKKLTKITAVLTAAMTLGAATLAGCGEETADVAVSVESVNVDENGNLIVRFSDGTTKNAGTVDGKDGKDGDNGENGKDGISVRDVYVDGNGDLIVLLSDGTKRNAGNVKQPESVFLNKAATFDTGYSDPDGGVAEIVRYNADNGKIYLVNGKTRTLDVVSLGVYPDSDGELETTFDEETDRIFFDELAEEHPEDFGSGFVVGVVTFDVTNFLYGEVDCKNYSTTRDYSQAMAGDVAPEGMDFVYASEAVGGKNLLIVANENSGTVAFYALESFKAEYEMHAEFKAGQAQPADHPVIFSVYGSGGKTDGTVSHNYIAIKNPTDEAIDLSGYALRYTADASAADGWQEFALSGSIAAGEIYIVRGQAANTTSAVLAIGENDFRAEWSDLSVDNKAYSVQLVRGGNVVDAFGMSDGTTTEVGEGVLASDCSKQKIVVRKNDADTDDNATDFEVVSLKDLSADSETVLECLRKLGLTA